MPSVKKAGHPHQRHGVTMEVESDDECGSQAASGDAFEAVRSRPTTPVAAKAVLEAIGEVIAANGHEPSATAYFGALMSMLERAGETDTSMTEGVCYLLSSLLTSSPGVPPAVLTAKSTDATEALLRTLQAHAQSSITTRHILTSLAVLSVHIARSSWTAPPQLRLLQSFLVFSCDPRPKIRKAACHAVRKLVEYLQTLPAAVSRAALHCLLRDVQNDEDGGEQAALHVCGLLHSTGVINALPEAAAADLLEKLHDKALKAPVLALRVAQVVEVAVACSGRSQAFLEGMLRLLTAQQPSPNDVGGLCAWIPAVAACVVHLTPNEVPVASLLVDLLLHDKQPVRKATIEAMTRIVKECTPHPADLMSAVEWILSYRFKSHWPSLFPIICTAIQATSRLTPALSSLILSVDALCTAAPDEMTGSQTQAAQSAIASAVATLGAGIVLELLPLQLDAVADDGPIADGLTSSRAYLLPLLQSSARGSPLAVFGNVLLPLIERLEARSSSMQDDSQRQALRAVILQLWTCFPTFCLAPADADAVLPGALIASLCKHLSSSESGRGPICKGLIALPTPSPDCINAVAGVLLPALFTVISTIASDPRCAYRQVMLDCAQRWSSIARPDLVNRMFKSVLKRLLTSAGEGDADTRRAMMDIAISMCAQLDDGNRDRLLRAVSPYLSSNADGPMQKRAYKAWRLLLERHPDMFCNDVVATVNEFAENLQHLAAPAKKARLRCIAELAKRIPAESLKETLPVVLGECILAVKETSFKTRDAAYTTLLSMADRVDLVEFQMMVLGGLAGTQHMQSATVLALSRILYEKKAVLTAESTTQMLETVLLLLQNRSREVVQSVLGFVKVAVSSLGADALRPHLPAIIAGLFKWGDESKNRFRQKTRVILERLLRRFAFDDLRPLVPERHRAFLDGIERNNKRKKRDKRPAKRVDGGAGEEYEDVLFGGEAADDEHDDQRAAAPTAAAPWLASTDDPVDLLDGSLAAKNVRASGSAGKRQRQDAGGSFPVDEFGKLIIDDDDADDDNVERQGPKPVARPDKRRRTSVKKQNAGGDAKRKGQALEPYAYRTLDPRALSRRHQAKTRGTFDDLAGKSKARKAGKASARKSRR
ncbi:hypothetical protein PBRA_006456 [Plasmodiophora brassicae]|uniref:Uncharacterized protein n=1 Tax=Plasmodiophora brassicae TaxID=37360 RepID=A0A0G4ISZ0_PLABS|nr:hypothetical protein PBRA_006456 [Plasmodiophora brassicae]